MQVNVHNADANKSRVIRPDTSLRDRFAVIELTAAGGTVCLFVSDSKADEMATLFDQIGLALRERTELTMGA